MTAVIRPEISALLTQGDALQLIDILAESGFETRFIGGCVRDVLLQRHPIGDIDLATTAPPQIVIEQLHKHHIHVVPTGLDHGTVMAVLNGTGYEITTLRRDVVTDGRHAQVEFTDDWQQDAHRRDFTINALSVDRHGALHDYCDGLSDLDAKKLRFIDDPASRIREDYLRILRLFRFASVLGWSIDDPALLQLCHDMAPAMQQLSRERVQSELFKLLGGVNCLAVADQLAAYDLLRPWLPTLYPQQLAGIVKREQSLDLCDPFRRLIALSSSQAMADLSHIIVLSRQQKKRLQDIARFRELPVNDQADPVKFRYFFGAQATEDCLVLFHPHGWTSAILTQWDELGPAHDFPLKAGHLLDKTGGANALLGRVLKQAEIFWVEQNFQPDLAALQIYADKWLALEQQYKNDTF